MGRGFFELQKMEARVMIIYLFYYIYLFIYVANFHSSGNYGINLSL